MNVYNHPLPITKRMQDLTASGDGLIACLIFALGFSFIPTGIITFITKEREVNIKHQHMISGVSLIAYWSANFFWDIIKHMVTSIICSLLVLAFQISIFTTDSNDYGCIWMLIILSGVASAPFSYFCSFFFKDHTVAQTFMLILSFITGSVLPNAVFIFFAFDSSRPVAKVLKWVLSIFPNFAFGWGVLSVGSQASFAGLDGRGAYGAFNINSGGGSLLMLGLMSILYFALVLLAETYETSPKIAKLFNKNTIVTPETYEDDDDVVVEAAKAKATDPEDVQVNVQDLKKVFKIGNQSLVAVNGISFNVEKEECFALLGVNGAGKTTTFKMLTGELPSEFGSASVGGKSISNNLREARNLIGYCPQFDSLSEFLTAREHLNLYSAIKGIPTEKIEEQVNRMLKYMDLEQYKDIVAGTYSGGNKRKLSVAIALIGNPTVVFLDEPSAGMDPESRKKMWKILGSIKKKKSAVILTTHSMEEAEALCDRMTIMVKGRLKCIGSSTHIKNKFGEGYELEIKVEIPNKSEINDYCHALENLIGTGDITFENLDKSLEALGCMHLKPYIVPVGHGSLIYSTITSDKKITKQAFSSWCLIEKHGKDFKDWLESEFKESEVIEHYNLMFKFKLKRENVRSIGYLFSALEKNKIPMKISDYSISMTSLEQIFNSFAKQAEVEELRILRGN